MARRAESTIVPVSDNGFSVYLKAELTTDYAFPFDPRDELAVYLVPNRGVLILPKRIDLDETDIQRLTRIL